MNERTDIHVFNQLCCLTTVHSEEALSEVLQTRPDTLAFDLDTYRLAIKHLLPPGQSGTTLVEFGG
jgi:DNA polymerase-3 subunit epsilon